jgi:hypothetical protein
MQRILKLNKNIQNYAIIYKLRKNTQNRFYLFVHLRLILAFYDQVSINLALGLFMIKF